MKQQLDNKRGGDGKSRVVVASDRNNSGIVKILNDGDSRTSVIVKNDGFGFGTNVKFGVIVYQKDDISMIYEPLACIVEWIAAVNLANCSGLQNSWDLGEGCLQEDLETLVWKMQTKSALFTKL